MTEEITRKPEYTVEYLLAQIEEIRRGMDYITDVVAKLEAVRSDGPEDLGAQAKARGLADVVRCRETTNQQLLKLYEKMFDKLTRDEDGVRLERYNMACKLADVAIVSDDYAASRSEMMDDIRQIMKENP